MFESRLESGLVWFECRSRVRKYKGFSMSTGPSKPRYTSCDELAYHIKNNQSICCVINLLWIDFSRDGVIAEEQLKT